MEDTLAIIDNIYASHFHMTLLSIDESDAKIYNSNIKDGENLNLNALGVQTINS